MASKIRLKRVLRLPVQNDHSTLKKVALIASAFLGVAVVTHLVTKKS